MAPVAEYELMMDAADWHWFQRHGGTDRCLPAEFKAGSTTWPVWIGYRGRYSRQFRKRPYDIWFGSEQRFEGHAQLHLNPAYRDPSLLRGRVALGLFADLGVPTPRTWHVWLTMNGQPLGLYTAGESLDAAWLHQRGLSPEAIYYGVGSRGTFGLVDPKTGRRKRFLAKGYEKCYPDDDDFSDLERLLHTISGQDDPASAETFDQFLHVETWLRWLVGLEFTSHTDGLVQNYALFRTTDARWQISPWDCDGTLGRIPNGHRFHGDEMEMGTGDDNELIARLLREPRWQRRYLAIWIEGLRGVLAPERIAAKVQEIHREIRPYALRDPHKRLGNSSFLREPAVIRAYLGERTEYARERLAELRAVWQVT